MRDTITKDRQYLGIFTFLTAGGTMAEYYTTAAADEIIQFKEADGTQRYLDATLVENCGAAVMYVLPLNGIHPVCLPVGGSLEIETVALTGIQVLGASGQKIRYSGCYY